MTVPSVTPSGCQVRESVWARVCVDVIVDVPVCASICICAHKCVCACCLLMCPRVCQTSGLTSVFEHLHSTHRSKQQLPNKSLGVSL